VYNLDILIILFRALRNEIAVVENELGVDHKDVVNTTWNPWIDNL
jgi:hypothetical protein